MNSRIRFASLVFTIILILLASAVFTVPARADDEAPPPTEELASSPDSSATHEEVTAGTLAQVPQEIEIVVIDEAGEILPLASEEAAQIIAIVDPVWCPTGVAPQNGTGGCTTSYASLFQLTDDIATDTISEPAANGVIWIGSGSDASISPIVIDGNDPQLGSWKNFSLTLKGGWNGIFGSTITSPAPPSTFSKSITITNWNADVTLSDIVISGVAAGDALSIVTDKKIIINSVKTNGNTGVRGAYIDNENTGTSSDVTITASEFNNNTANGLEVYSNGNITLQNVIANSNGDHGVYLDNDTAATAKNVTGSSGTFEFNNNGQGGLVIFSKGSITLKDMTAAGNQGPGWAGVYANNTASTTAAGIALTGTNVFASNLGNGLQAYSDGKITASNLIANNNGLTGAYVDNTTAATALPVTITGTNQFMFNAYGTSILSNGAITLNNVQAGGNLEFGAQLDNDASIAAANITLTGTNIFNHNDDDGLVIDSDGAISLSNITASYNGIGDSNGFGADIDNSGAPTPKAVTLTGTNTFNNNYDGGIQIVSKGAITISNLTASDNDGTPTSNGTTLDNSDSPSSPQNVTLTGAGVFNDNGNGGLIITSFGMIKLGALTANDNAGGSISGAYIDNSQSATAVTPKGITLSGALSTFNDNIGGGLTVVSSGAITLNSITAHGNGYVGLTAANHYTGGVGGITLNGTSSFEDNGYGAIDMHSRGTITIKDFTADSNSASGGFGAVVISNAHGGSIGNIVLGTNKAGWCNSVSNNEQIGLDTASFGTITLNNMCVSENGNPAAAPGADLDNSAAATPKAVILKGTNSFNDNNGIGLTISSRGAVTLDNVTANDNGGKGIVIVNQASGTGTPQNVTINGYADISGNSGIGLEIDTFGAVVLNKLYANSNGGDGINVDNQSGTDISKAKPVTLNGYVQSYNNGGLGLSVVSYGAIKINNLDASAGNTDGATLNNQFLGVTNPITLTGFAHANGNDANGLTVSSYGSIAVANLNASGNVVGHGADLNNNVAGSVGTVTLTGTNLVSSNSSLGLGVNSNGAIKINSLTASSNSGDGASLISDTPGIGGITLTGKNQFEGNSVFGLYANSAGSIIVNNLTANSNGTGAYLQTLALSGPQTSVTLTGINSFNNNNGGPGLWVRSEGQITISNLTATGNADRGARLDNTTYGYNTPGVKLTGTNSFFGNSDHGLDISALGFVDLSKVYSNDNVGSGLRVSASSSILLICAGINSNGVSGWNLTSSGTITLKGVYGFGNTSGNITNVTPVVVRNCPLP